MTVELPAAALAKRIELKFQGGFAGRECVLLSGDSGEKLQEVQKFYPEDINSNQVSFHSSIITKFLYNIYSYSYMYDFVSKGGRAHLTFLTHMKNLQ